MDVGSRIMRLMCPCFSDTQQKILNPRCTNSSFHPPLKESFTQSLETWGHRLMSRLPSQLLLPAASPYPLLSKKGCFRESAKSSLLDGSYSNMLSMRSNNWWCSSASDSKYRWQGQIRERTDMLNFQESDWCNSNAHFYFVSTINHHFLLTRRGLQFSLTYFPADELSSQSRRPR